MLLNLSFIAFAMNYLCNIIFNSRLIWKMILDHHVVILSLMFSDRFHKLDPDFNTVNVVFVLCWC